MTTIDLDDFCEETNRMDLLLRLKELRPDFKVTVFAIPALGSKKFWASVPDWVELAVHGWLHPTPRECGHWTYDVMDTRMRFVDERFVHGFKAPGWQISGACYEWLADHGWWVADQDYNDKRRPANLPVYKIDGWHGHVHDVCGNGIAESWDQVVKLVQDADGFRFASEALK